MKGFSKLSKNKKIEEVISARFAGNQKIISELKSYWHSERQDLFDQFSENTLSNFYIPFGVVPAMVINGKEYTVPMAIEESSVVAACSKSASFWNNLGGFHAEVISTTKVGQIHFYWEGEELADFFQANKYQLLQSTSDLTKNMDQRGGGIKNISLLDKRSDDPNYFQIWMEFDTCDAMGANFINSVLERVAATFETLVSKALKGNLEIVMSILSNYTPSSLVRAWVECSVDDLGGKEIARKIARAVKISKLDPYRATTHNKGIFNGIDAVVIATGNDFRAVEAAGHTYASRNGSYQGLTDVTIEDDRFIFSLTLPLSVGTVGGLTTLHPLARLGLKMLGGPGSSELMTIIAAVGLAQNYAALRSLVTFGIQKGHMKMHLMNIMNHFDASLVERERAVEFFANKTVSFAGARDFIDNLRSS